MHIHSLVDQKIRQIKVVKMHRDRMVRVAMVKLVMVMVMVTETVLVTVMVLVPVTDRTLVKDI